MTHKLPRVLRLQENMRKSQIDAIIVPLGINFRWLFGMMEEPSERLLVSIIKAEGSIEMITPGFEVERIKNFTGINNVHGWEETEDPYKILSDIIHFEENKIVGIEPKMWFDIFEKIKFSCKGVDFLSAEQLFSSLRSVKDEEEQKFLFKASQKSGNTIVNVLDELESGITEKEVQNLLNKRLTWGNNEKTFSLVQFGSNSALPHYCAGDRTLKKDDVVLIDAGGTIKNYWGDITITVVFGKACQRFKDIFDIVFNANKIGKEAVIQGKLPSDVDRSVRKHIQREGYGDYFTHRTGHGLGLEVHEAPYIIENNDNPLVPGNVFTIEPGIYLPGEFGIRIEENVIKTQSGIQTSNIPRYELLEI